MPVTVPRTCSWAKCSAVALHSLLFQKHLWWQATLRLQLSENLDATTPGYHVGYVTAAQSMREYKRFFGTPPRRNIKQQRETVTEVAAEF